MESGKNRKKSEEGYDFKQTFSVMRRLEDAFKEDYYESYGEAFNSNIEELRAVIKQRELKILYIDKMLNHDGELDSAFVSQLASDYKQESGYNDIVKAIERHEKQIQSNKKSMDDAINKLLKFVIIENPEDRKQIITQIKNALKSYFSEDLKLQRMTPAGLYKRLVNPKDEKEVPIVFSIAVDENGEPLIADATIFEETILPGMKFPFKTLSEKGLDNFEITKNINELTKDKESLEQDMADVLGRDTAPTRTVLRDLHEKESEQLELNKINRDYSTVMKELMGYQVDASARARLYSSLSDPVMMEFDLNQLKEIDSVFKEITPLLKNADFITHLPRKQAVKLGAVLANAGTLIKEVLDLKHNVFSLSRDYAYAARGPSQDAAEKKETRKKLKAYKAGFKQFCKANRELADCRKNIFSILKELNVALSNEQVDLLEIDKKKSEKVSGRQNLVRTLSEKFNRSQVKKNASGNENSNEPIKKKEKRKSPLLRRRGAGLLSKSKMSRNNQSAPVISVTHKQKSFVGEVKSDKADLLISVKQISDAAYKKGPGLNMIKNMDKLVVALAQQGMQAKIHKATNGKSMVMTVSNGDNEFKLGITPNGIAVSGVNSDLYKAVCEALDGLSDADIRVESQSDMAQSVWVSAAEGKYQLQQQDFDTSIEDNFAFNPAVDSPLMRAIRGEGSLPDLGDDADSDHDVELPSPKRFK